MSLLINGAPYTSLHFVGILGSGMSALAQYLHWSSVNITGSDRMGSDTSTKRIRNILESLGCRMYHQDGSGISLNTGAIVVSTAIEDSNPDIAKAQSLDIPVFHRSEVLAAIVNSTKTIAVAGTSGKSTVTALIFHLLASCGKKPSLITGANLHGLVEKGYIGNAFYDTADLLIIEADESDGSLIKYTPFISVFLNLSKDHKPVDETLSLFKTLAAQSEHVFSNGDDPNLATLHPTQTFGFNKGTYFHSDKTVSNNASAGFVRNEVTFSVPFPGKHMEANLLTALHVCTFLDCDTGNLSLASSDFKGIQRRFDRIETSRGITVIDDYAHNPEKIRAALNAVQSLTPRVFALFQPHGFGPTKFLLDELITVFNQQLRENDTLFLLPIYYAGGSASKDISSSDIAMGLHNSPGTIETPDDREEVLSTIASHTRPGDIVISMGARDPSLPLFAQSIADAIDTNTP